MFEDYKSLNDEYAFQLFASSVKYQIKIPAYTSSWIEKMKMLILSRHVESNICEVCTIAA